MNQIEEIASKHLGRTSDGGTMTRYETPEEADANLLVGIPRKLNREAYGIDDEKLPFGGYDTWNCYETSFMLENGYPVSGVLKLCVPVSSPNICESKSLKLYLNSFNMQKMGNSLHSAINKFESTVQADIATCVGSAVTVHFHTMFDKGREKFPVSRKYITLDQILDFENITFDQYAEDPSILKVKADPKSEHRFTTNILRSNCRVTNQPDWGDVFIYMKGDYTIEPESLLQYLVSMRTENHFHEEIAECIYKRLIDLFPEHVDLGVLCLYTRRGGIDINPMRCSNYNIMETEFEKLWNVFSQHGKTMRQ